MRTLLDKTLSLCTLFCNRHYSLLSSQLTPTVYSEALPFTYSVCCYGYNYQLILSITTYWASKLTHGASLQLTNSIIHNSVTVFFVLGNSLYFTKVANGFEHGLEAGFSTLVIDHRSRPLGNEDQASLCTYRACFGYPFPLIWRNLWTTPLWYSSR